MNTSNKHSVDAHTERQSTATKASRVIVALVIVASVAAPFLSAFHHSHAAKQQIVHHICSSCGEEIPQGTHYDIKIAGGLSGGVVNDNA